MEERTDKRRSLDGLLAAVPELGLAVENARRAVALRPEPNAPKNYRAASRDLISLPPLEELPDAISLQDDALLYPDLINILRKIYNEHALEDAEWASLVSRFQSDPVVHRRLFDNILDALNLRIAEQLAWLAGAQESLRYHNGVKHLRSTGQTGLADGQSLPGFLTDKGNKDSRHPNMGRSSLFHIIPTVVERIVLDYPDAGVLSFKAHFEMHFQGRFLEAMASGEHILDERYGDRSIMGVWKLNQEARAFLYKHIHQLDLPAGEAGQFILTHEVERLYDFLFRKHYSPLIAIRGPLIPERVLWDDILMPALLDFFGRYDKLNPQVRRDQVNESQSGYNRRNSFSTAIRTFLTQDLANRFNAILRENRRRRQSEIPSETPAPNHEPDFVQTLLDSNESDTYENIISALSPRTRDYWNCYLKLLPVIQAQNPSKKRIQGLVFAAIAKEVGSSSKNHARNKIYEVRRRLEVAGLAVPPKPRGKAALKTDQSAHMHPPRKGG